MGKRCRRTDGDLSTPRSTRARRVVSPDGYPRPSSTCRFRIADMYTRTELGCSFLESSAAK